MTIFRSVLIGMFCAVFALPDRVWAVDFFEAVTGVGQCPGNYKTATDMLKKQPSLANFTHKFGGQEESILEGVIRGCCIADDSEYKDCRRGNKKKNRDQMAQLLIDNHADIDRVIERKIYIGRNSRGEETVHGTLLDYVRALKESQNCWKYGSAFCDKIEAAMVKAGAKTYEDLQKAQSATTSAATPTTPTTPATPAPAPSVQTESESEPEVTPVVPAAESKNTSSVAAKLTDISISGTVVDAKNNESLVGVNIALMQSDGTTMINNAGCITDADGNFSASFNNIPQDAKMRVSYVGYEQQLLSLGQNVKIALQPTQRALETVVVSAKICTDEVLAELKASKGEKGEDANGQTFCKPTDCLEGYHLQEPEKVICVKDDDVVTSADTGTAEVPNNSKPEKPKPQIDQKAIDDAESAYSNAKAKETSTANRMLGGLTMAATGIGGMQLAQGLAEQNADKKAEQDMAAYLTTFQCKIGDKGGKSYSGGEMGIEVGGTNQLVNLYQQYVDLAASLKERKTALGMAPGIESQVVMDKASMGLYDAEGGKGIENGTYASLYRASRGNETDAQKLAEQKNTSATRVKAGAIAAGVGVVGGIVGNQLINGDKDKVNEADCKKAGGTFKDGKCNCSGKKVYKDGKCVESAVSNLSAKAGEVLGSKVAPDQTSTTPDQSTDEESTGDDETVSEDKIKECVQYINENVHFVGPFKEHNCERLAIKLDDSLFLALTNEEAAALSTVWDWGCSSVDTYKLYGAGSHDIDKDACTTVENMKNFVAKSKKTCDEYSGYETQNMVDWTVCLPKSWGPEVLDDDTDDATTEEQEPVASIESQRIKGGACLEQDLPTNATKGHYITTGRNNLDCKDGIKCSCAAQECRTGFTVKKVNGKSQGYCVKK